MLVRTGMYRSLRFNLGMLPCGWIRCCNSAQPRVLYWRLQHLITLMQAQACFSQPRQALPPIWLPPLPLLAGGVGSAGFSGGVTDSPRRFFSGRGRARRWRRQRVLVWDHGWVGHGSSLSDELAGQVLGRWMSPSAGFLVDVVVECSERVAELCPKFVRGHGIQVGFST